MANETTLPPTVPEGSLFSTSSLPLASCLFDNSQSDKYELSHCGFDLHPLMVMLSTFSCAFWPCICLLWKNIYSSPDFLMELFGILILWCMSSLFILDIDHLTDISFANIFSHSMIIFLIYWWFPWLCKSFLFWYSPICLLLLLFPLPERTAKTGVKNLLPSFLLGA